MRPLLDTHAFLWFVSGSNKLSATARRCIADSADLVASVPRTQQLENLKPSVKNPVAGTLSTP